MASTAIAPLAWVLSLWATGSAFAQDHRTTIGRFVDLDGMPVAGATITFATSPLQVFDAFAPTTVLSATTDAEGRYRVSLRTGQAYSAFAIGPDDPSGRARSVVREGVIAGNLVDFAAAVRGMEVSRLQLPVDLLAALHAPPLFAVVRIDALHHLPLRLPIQADGTVLLPPLPHSELKVHLTDAAGAIVAPSVATYADQGTFGDPQTRRFRVRDVDGKPVAGAVVTTTGLDFFGRGADPFGTLRVDANIVRSRPTDADGRTEMRLPAGRHLFLASAPGFACAATGVLNGTWIQDGALTDGPDRLPEVEVTFALSPAPALRGRLHRGDRPLAHLGVKLKTELHFERRQAAGAMWTSIDHVDTTRTDADGNFVFACTPKAARGLHLAVQPTVDDAPPLLLLPREAVPEHPLDLELATWPIVTFRGTACGGGPASDLRVILLPGHTRVPSPELVILPADRAGRVVAQLEPGTWFVFATDGDGAWTDVATIANGDATEIAIRLAPLERLLGTLCDAGGEPIAGVGFHFGGTMATATTPDTPLVELLLRQHATTLTRGLTANARTDAKGRFVLRWFAVPGVTMIGSPAGHDGCQIELRAGMAGELDLRAAR